MQVDVRKIYFVKTCNGTRMIAYSTLSWQWRPSVNQQQIEMEVMKEDIIRAKASRWVFRMPKLTQHKTRKQEWYSHPFYINPGSTPQHTH